MASYLKNLPTFYYLTNFNEMLDFVQSTYSKILSQKELRFIKDFYALSKDEKCLYIRMANRKGIIFKRDQLCYEEIADCLENLESLTVKGFVRLIKNSDIQSILSFLTKSEILEISNKLLIKTKSSWKKDILIDFVLSNENTINILGAINKNNLIVQNQRDTLNYLLFLYFGKTHTDLNSFTLRDLGLVSVSKAKSFKARFVSTTEAKNSYILNTINSDLKKAEYITIPSVLAKINEVQSASEHVLTLRSKAYFKLAVLSENKGEYLQAIEILKNAHYPEAKEKLIKLTYSHKSKAEAKILLEEVISDPDNDDEYYFAQDFYARKFEKVKLSQNTQILRDAITLNIDESHRNYPERGAIQLYKDTGWEAYHVENDIWRCLFGLIFWDELHCSKTAFHSEFDKMPQSLKDGSFYQIFEKQIENTLESLNRDKTITSILKTIANHQGKRNAIFNWRKVNIEILNKLIKYSPQNSLNEIMRKMAQNYAIMRDGFPDLLLIKNDNIKFIEIKAEGDIIRKNQLTRFKQLNDLGFKCEIAKVVYRFNPNQEYVVVDIETTGGRKPHHRITEIGAVKIKNFKVIDKWQSLINPQRPIPANITKLTGINNNMVKNAPLFSEIADEFEEFSKDAVFVAHSVNFDYGFISNEYERLSRRYRRPKFCTCANMRKYYKGHKSYSLGNLSREYGIKLENHHRAFDDAMAASELLNLINEKRLN